MIVWYWFSLNLVELFFQGQAIEELALLKTFRVIQKTTRIIVLFWRLPSVLSCTIKSVLQQLNRTLTLSNHIKWLQINQNVATNYNWTLYESCPETSWDWAWPSSAQAGIRLNFNFLHHQNSTCNGWDITKNIIASHGISGRLASGLAR